MRTALFRSAVRASGPVLGVCMVRVCISVELWPEVWGDEPRSGLQCPCHYISARSHARELSLCAYDCPVLCVSCGHWCAVGCAPTPDGPTFRHLTGRA